MGDCVCVCVLPPRKVFENVPLSGDSGDNGVCGELASECSCCLGFGFVVVVGGEVGGEDFRFPSWEVEENSLVEGDGPLSGEETLFD